MILFETTMFLQKIIGCQSGGVVKKIAYIIVPIIASILVLLLIISLSLNIVLNVRGDISKSWSSLLPIFIILIFTTIHWHLLKNRGRFYCLLDDMQDIVNERMSLMRNKKVYEQAHQRIISRLKTVTYVLVFTQSLAVTPFLFVVYHLCFEKYTINSWFFYTTVWTPFELNTTLRCAAVAFWEAYFSTYVFVFYYSIVCLFIEVTVYTKTFMLDIKAIFGQLDELLKCKSSELLLIDYCKEAVDLHVRVYRCMHQLVAVANGIVLVLVPTYVISVCISLMSIITTAKHLDRSSLIDLQLPFLVIVCAFLVLLILFFFGQKLHSDLMELSDMIYQSEWYRYPRSVRRFVLLMMLRSQQPLHLSAYGFIALNLENFVNVLKWIYSAFMLFHNTY